MYTLNFGLTLVTALLFNTCYGQIMDCSIQKTVLIRCEEKLSVLIGQTLASRYGINSITVDDLNNTAINENMMRATKDVVCSWANKESSDCLVFSIRKCPNLLTDADVVSKPLGFLTTDLWEKQDTTDKTLCDIIATGLCDSIRPRFKTCYLGLYGQIIDDINAPLKNVCRLETKDAVDCTINMLNDCVNLMNEPMTSTIKTKIANEEWVNYRDASHYCDCDQGKTCWSTALFEFTLATVPASGSVRDIYISALKVGETSCRNHDNLRCAYLRLSRCPTSLGLLSKKDTMTLMYNIANATCDVFSGSDYEPNKVCILNRLIDVFHPCIQKAKLPSPVQTCKELKTVYSCSVLALRGKCGGDFEYTMFELLRGDAREIKNCEVTSGVWFLNTSKSGTLLSAIFFVVFFVLFLS